MSDKRKSAAIRNGFAVVGTELLSRTKKPSGQFVYWTYFVIAVVILGGLGIWLELLQIHRMPPPQRDWNNTYTAVVTFFPALIGSSCLQMMFEAPSRRLQALSMGWCVLAGVTGAVLISAARPAVPLAWFWAVALSLFALWVWWVANANNTGLHDETPTDAPLGGDPEAPLTGGFGDVRI